MTTTVKVEAHCADNKEVIVTITSPNGETAKEKILQNGESFQDVVYDLKEISVKEVLKS